MKRYLVDTFAVVAFSTMVGAFVEVVVTGLTIEQSVRIRLAAVPIMLVTGRPYGIYRDWLFRLLSNKNSGPLKTTAIDTLANMTFQIPVYACLLALNGATIGQIFTAVGSILLILLLSGRPYGVFLVWCRRLFRVTP